MRYHIKAFGIAREILGGNEVEIEVSGKTVAAATLGQTLSWIDVLACSEQDIIVEFR